MLAGFLVDMFCCANGLLSTGVLGGHRFGVKFGLVLAA